MCLPIGQEMIGILAELGVYVDHNLPLKFCGVMTNFGKKLNNICWCKVIPLLVGMITQFSVFDHRHNFPNILRCMNHFQLLCITAIRTHIMIFSINASNFIWLLLNSKFCGIISFSVFCNLFPFTNACPSHYNTHTARLIQYGFESFFFND